MAQCSYNLFLTNCPYDSYIYITIMVRFWWILEEIVLNKSVGLQSSAPNSKTLLRFFKNRYKRVITLIILNREFCNYFTTYGFFILTHTTRLQKVKRCGATSTTHSSAQAAAHTKILLKTLTLIISVYNDLRGR